MKNYCFYFFLGLFLSGSVSAQNFTGTCGENQQASGSLSLNQSVILNGQSDLSSCIKGNNGAFAKTISLGPNGGGVGYSYQIWVAGQGPSGLDGGSFYLRFYDKSNDYYDLSLYLSEYNTHEVSFNSDDPTIKAIIWSDNSFPSYPFCSDCEALLQKVFDALLDEATGCSELSDGFLEACDLAGGGPEDIIADMVCEVASYEIGQMCDEVSYGVLTNAIDSISKALCTKIKLCQ